MPTRDHKDLPHSSESVATAQESSRERAARKAHESHTLDEALQETFPTSDPISPFVPAARPSSEQAVDETSQCAHAACTCAVQPSQRWCSDACRDQQQGYLQPGVTCACDHAACAHGEHREARAEI